MTRSLAELTWQEAAAAAANGITLALPIGATEQHGPHLPLFTDTTIATALADALADAVPSVLRAPGIAYGASGEHADFPGTLSIGTAATRTLLVELVRSASESFSRVLLVCAHGGNRSALLAAEAQLVEEGRPVRSFAPRWDGDAHAGRIETSLMLALRPESVQLDRAAAGALTPLAQLMPQLVEGGVASVSANGVLGDPAGASAEEGGLLLREAVEQMCELLEQWSVPGRAAA